MKIAILGATSQIARDLIISFSQYTNYQCILFSRSPDKVRTWLDGIDSELVYLSYGYTDFMHGEYDAIINFVGAGDPARIKETGSLFFDITYQYDQLAVDYIRVHPECKYVFLSSGAVYGEVFSQPVDSESVAQVPVNYLNTTNHYAIAKLYAEARHRALSDYSIIDVRVFNYFSHTQELSSRFLMTDIIRAIREQCVLKVSSENIVRDFLHPSDFYQLIQCLLTSCEVNVAVDCYTSEPVDKFTLLEVMKEEFGLCYEVSSEAGCMVNATGVKSHYYSLNRRAKELGYSPDYSALGCIQSESKLILRQD